MANEMHVKADTPPTFMFYTVDDGSVPVENALVYGSALRKAGVSFEMHLFEHGRHGVGMATKIRAGGLAGPICHLAARAGVYQSEELRIYQAM